jgi:hypothetical protein
VRYILDFTSVSKYQCLFEQGCIRGAFRASGSSLPRETIASTPTASHTQLLTLSTSQQRIAMLDVEDFDAVFQGLSYTDGLVQQILEYQQALGGQTFFERLLELLKIKGLYPNSSSSAVLYTDWI